MGDKERFEEKARAIAARRSQLQEGRERAFAVHTAINRELMERVSSIPGSYNKPGYDYKDTDDTYTVEITADNANRFTMPYYRMKGTVEVQDNAQRLIVSVECYAHLGYVPNPNIGTHPMLPPVIVSCKKTFQIAEVDEGSICQWVRDVVNRFIDGMQAGLRAS
jgi:hypothetical protein